MRVWMWINASPPQGGNYLLVMSMDQYRMVKSSMAGIKVKPTTDKSGKMTFKLNQSQWDMFQANQAKAAAANAGKVWIYVCDSEASFFRAIVNECRR